MNFLKELLNEMSGPVAEQLGQREGLSESQSRGFLEGLAPVVLSGLKRKKDEGVNLEGLLSGLGAGEEQLDQLSGFFENNQQMDLGAGGVLGLEKGEQAAEALANKAGIGVDVARRVMPLLIPVVMSFLMKKGRQDPKTADRKSGVEGILDRDGDGKILDDIAGMVLASQGGRRRGGFLGMILSLFSRR